MKKTLLLLLSALLLMSAKSSAQTTLTQGDIAFIGINPNSLDNDFSFIILKNISAGTEIKFTDCGWTNGGGFNYNPGESGFITWTATSAMSSGSIVYLRNDDIPTSSVGTLFGYPLDLDPEYDQVFAFQGNFIASPNIISGIHYTMYSTDSDESDWSGQCLGQWDSALPNSLTNGINAIWLYANMAGSDNFKYDCTVTTGDASTLSEAINNLSNWAMMFPASFQLDPFPCPFSVTDDCNDPEIPTVTANPTSICSGSSTTLTISGSLNDATAWHIYTGGCGVTSIGNTSSSTFSVSPTSPTTYYIRGEGGCVFPEICASVTVNIATPDDPSFSYNSASYCINTSNPVPTVTGVLGGTFSSTAGLSISESSGTIDLNSSTLGTYTITYTTTGDCANSSSMDITIISIEDQIITPEDDSFCNTGTTNINLASSELNVNYYLRDDANNDVIDGPIAGTGSGISLNTGNITSTKTYNVYAQNATATELEFDGINDYASAPAIIPSSGDFTVALWAKQPNTQSQFREIISQGTSGNAFYIGHNTTGDFRFGDDWGVPNLAFPSDGQWHHYTLVKSSSNTHFYIDGVLVKSKGSSILNPINTELYLARQYGTHGEYFGGTIDELYIWNTALISDSIQALLDPCAIGQQTGMLVHYDFNDAQGLTITDVSGNGNNATLNAMEPNSDWVNSQNQCSACDFEMSTKPTITISPLDDPSFSYNAPAYCVDASDPTPVITGLTGGAFSSTPGLSISESTGTIDVSASVPGLHFINYTSSGTCPNSAGAIVMVNALDDPSFSYSAASYCVADSDPSPIITGLTGGTYSSTAGLNISASTGTIDLSASNPGTYTVSYTTSGTCPNTSNQPITIHSDDPSFNYNAASYCLYTPDPTPTITGLAGGTFSSTAGLSLDASTGHIIVNNSMPGTYTVTYTTSGACPNSSNTSITINALDDASFNYTASSFCVSALDPMPTVTGVVGGTFSSTAGLSIDASTGTIDVSASTPGTYSVTYTTSGTCPNPGNVYITIQALDDASFNYDAYTYCMLGADPTPTITGITGGIFSSTSGLSIDASTGTIDVSASTLGIDTITYTTSGACPNTSSTRVSINTLDDASFNYSATAYCADASDPTPIITGSFFGTFASTTGLSISASSGTIDLSASTPGIYTITYTTSGTCPNSSNTSLTIMALDDPSFSYSGANYCMDAFNPTPTITGLEGGTYSSSAGVSIFASTGNIDLSTSTPGIYTISYTTSGTCPNSASQMVSIDPIYNLTETDYVCAGESYTFPDGTTQDNITEQVIYTSNLTSVNTCDSIIVSTVNVYQSYDLTETDYVCAGESYTFPDGTTQDNIIEQVIYTSNLTTVNTCDSIMVSTVNVYQSYDLTETDYICAGESYTFPDGTTQDNITEQIVYTSNLTSENTCDSIMVTTLEINTVDVSLIQDNAHLTANALSVDYQWLDCNNAFSIIADEMNQEFTASLNGSYAVEITEGACVDTSICYDITNVLIKAFEIENNIVVYPNPNEGVFTIALNKKYENLEINLRDINGKLIKNAKYASIENIEFNIDGANGIYFLELVTPESRIFVKVAKQ